MVEDYTMAFLVSAFCLTFLVLCAIWVIWGLMAAVISGWAADRALNRAKGAAT
ncbi:hypothetical protein [Oceaniglobus trochenteri]|uniref:hypothetical protein n=1 Tax=Oceaniglobus trochenteri TaxID=2763260 RepID=UPI001CFF7ABE|nr:hypothetical protein [Oceaniglobus trochenteri]